MDDIQYLTVDHLSTKDLTRVFSSIEIHPDLQHDGTPCWIWCGTRHGKGYGQTYRPGNRATKVHRLIFAWLVHPLPKNQKLGEVDHLCRRPSCCNPVHMEFVSTAINVLRSNCPPAVNARKTHCLNGHKLILENLWNTKKGRQCKICGRVRSRRDAANYRQRHPEESKASWQRSNRSRSEQRRLVRLTQRRTPPSAT
jgi:hypothetical protein